MKRHFRSFGISLAILIAVALSAFVALAVPVGREAVSAEPTWSLPDGRSPVVYLTFDAGNAPATTVDPLLALLAENDVRATFFLTGKWTLLHPMAARRIADAGHELANHSFDHPHMDRLPAPVQRFQVRAADLSMRVVCRKTPLKLFRPPHGDTDTELEAELASEGYTTVMWSKDPSDWRLDGSVTVSSIYRKIGTVRDGDIICFHLRNIETVEALKRLIPQLEARGFRFAALEASAE